MPQAGQSAFWPKRWQFKELGWSYECLRVIFLVIRT